MAVVTVGTAPNSTFGARETTSHQGDHCPGRPAVGANALTRGRMVKFEVVMKLPPGTEMRERSRHRGGWNNGRQVRIREDLKLRHRTAPMVRGELTGRPDQEVQSLMLIVSPAAPLVVKASMRGEP